MTEKTNVEDFFGKSVADTLSARELKHVPTDLHGAIWTEPAIGDFRACIKEADGADARLVAALLTNAEGVPVMTVDQVNKLKMRASVPLLKTAAELTEWLIKEMSTDTPEETAEGKPAGS